MRRYESGQCVTQGGMLWNRGPTGRQGWNHRGKAGQPVNPGCTSESPGELSKPMHAQGTPSGIQSELMCGNDRASIVFSYNLSNLLG